MRWRHPRLLLVFSVLSTGGWAVAGPADRQGITAGQQGRANPVAASAMGVSSLVMNPARMGLAERSQTFGLMVSGDSAKIALKARDASADIGSTIYGARRADGTPIPHNLATDDLPNLRTGRDGQASEIGAVLGIVVPLIPDKLSLGFLGYLPVKRPRSETYYVDEREAVFSNRLRLSLHEDDQGGQLLAGGLAYQPLPWMRVGLGVQLLIGADTVASAYIPDTLGELSNQTNIGLEVKPSFTPIVGIELEPVRGLLVQSSLRSSQATRTTGESRVRLWADDENPRSSMQQDIDFSVDWQPLRAALGAGYLREDWDVNLEAVYLRWSDFVDHHSEAPTPGFKNVVDLGLHGGYRYQEWNASAGFRYSPSPVPPQRGRQNHADSDRFTGGLAVGRSLQVAGESLEISVGAQLSAFAQRTETKDPNAAFPVVDEYPEAIDLRGDAIAESAGLQTNNPGWPGYILSGALWAANLSLTWKR